LLEYGVAIPIGITHVRSRLPGILTSDNDELSPLIKRLLLDLQDELLSTMKRIEKCDKELAASLKRSETCQRIAKVEGIGVITATAICASCPDPALFKNGRQFAAWLGLVPGHTQTDGKDSKPIMLGITKKGDKYLRKLSV
jgi:transposase